jgi:hypothetical protein
MDRQQRPGPFPPELSVPVARPSSPPVESPHDGGYLGAGMAPDEAAKLFDGLFPGVVHDPVDQVCREAAPEPPPRPVLIPRPRPGLPGYLQPGPAPLPAQPSFEEQHPVKAKLAETVVRSLGMTGVKAMSDQADRADVEERGARAVADDKLAEDKQATEERSQPAQKQAEAREADGQRPSGRGPLDLLFEAIERDRRR